MTRLTSNLSSVKMRELSRCHGNDIVSVESTTFPTVGYAVRPVTLQAPSDTGLPSMRLMAYFLDTPAATLKAVPTQDGRDGGDGGGPEVVLPISTVFSRGHPHCGTRL
jgi:hypothetical protein